MLEYSKILEYIFVAGAGQGFLLAVMLLRKKENSVANTLFGLLMIVFSLDLLYNVVYVGGYYLEYPHLIGASALFPYLYGPSIYLYVTILGHKREGFKASYLFHYVPFLLLLIYGIFFFYPESAQFKLDVVHIEQAAPLSLILIGNFIPVHGCTYVVFTYLEGKKFIKKFKQSYSTFDQFNLSRLKSTIIATSAVWGVVVISYILNEIYGEALQANVLIYVALTVMIFATAYELINQPEVSMIVDEPREPEEEEEKGISYRKSGLTDETAQAMQKRLLTYMEEEKPYTNPKLNLKDLSTALNVSTHNLSEVINTKLNQNFYDFINGYRVEEVKRLIEDDVNASYSILALGYDAGFSSKSAFYTAFKKFCDKTPAQYREEVKNPEKKSA